MEAIRGRTSLRASMGGATTVPRQSTSSSSSSRTSMNGMVLVPNAATATTVRDDRRRRMTIGDWRADNFCGLCVFGGYVQKFG